MQPIVAADFETTTNPEDARVWMWAITEVGGSRDTFWGKDIASYMRFTLSKGVETAYFHNLAFDGKFIIDFLFRAGYEHTIGKPRRGEFSTLVSSKGMFYEIKLVAKNGTRVTFRDSLKLFPMSIKRLAIKYGAEVSKGEIDYHKPRPVGYEPTPEEIDYTSRDTKIAAHALEINAAMGFTKMTVGANAMDSFKKVFGKKRFERTFPTLELDCDSELREAYRGGYTYADPKHQGKPRGAGISADYNSMYPSVMSDNVFPVGEPVPFSGQYEENYTYPLFVQNITCIFSLKPNKVPMIQLRGRGFYGAHEYVEETVEPVSISLCSVDLEIFMDMYNVDILSHDGGYMFMQESDLFTEFYGYWGQIKQDAKNDAERQEAKNIMNNLYGKFATNPDVTSKIPYFDDNVVCWELGPEEIRKPVYIPVAIFTTAYARCELIGAIMANRDRFDYCDTDSIHLDGPEPPEGIRMHETELSAWKMERSYIKAKHLRAKAYVLVHDDGTMTVKCAGMPNNIKEMVTFENFEFGFTNLDENGNILPGRGKLSPKTVPGGVVFVDRMYTLHL